MKKRRFKIGDIINLNKFYVAKEREKFGDNAENIRIVGITPNGYYYWLYEYMPTTCALPFDSQNYMDSEFSRYELVTKEYDMN